MAYSIKIRITTAVDAVAMVAVLCDYATNKVYQTNSGPGQASPPANSGGSTNAAPGSFDALTFCGITYSDIGLEMTIGWPDGVPESLSYDADGNLAEINGLSLGWDARNRVCEIDYGYGWCGYDNTGRPVLSYVGDQTRKWLYDGWNIVRSVHDDGCATETSDYVWGADLSGTLDGAGGVGGMLAVRHGGVWHFPLYDANGNITAYISEVGTVSATYAYGPFGETIAHTGLGFEHRFGTKPYNGELGTYTYIYREYSPTLGRWLPEDPILEQGGYNLYAYCGNDPVARYDYLGFSAKNKVIKVAKCHAYLYIGHSNKKYPIKWDMPTDGGAFGGAICCWPGINIPHETDWVWPDNPDHDDFWCWKMKDFIKNVNKINEVTFFPNLETNPNNILSNIWSEVALNKIIDKLSSEPYCCKEIWFEIEVGKDKIGETIIKNLVKRINWQQGEIRKFHYRVEVKNGK